jgi:Kef-type K+ transport system membrane component KefB
MDPGLVGPEASVPVFAAAIGICLAVTALPVLAALLKEMKIVHSDLGQQALGFAAMTDGALWISVSALLLVSAGARGGLWLLLLIPAYLAAALLLLPLLMARVAKQRSGNGEASDTVLIAATTIAFGSAFLSEIIGLGDVIGAFIAGAAMPGPVRAELIKRLDWPVTLLLMPFFFMMTGLRTEADLLSAPVLTMAAAATGLAMFGKIAGVAVPAILMGRGTRRSLALGVLLQSKGLMEVLVVTVLIDAGILTVRVFSALVLVAVFCTILAMPLTRLIVGRGRTREALIGFHGGGLQAGPAQ